MPHPVAWFEVLGKDADALGRFYGDLFQWKIEDAPMNYKLATADGERPQGGIGEDPTGGSGHVTFYVEVEDLQATLDKAERLGGRTVMPPNDVMDTAIALFEDPEGHTIGLVKPQPSP
jgi:predicted enzyme related to lactoylglutathione lyase